MTGAPIFLLTFLRWLKESEQLDIAVLQKNKGELSHKFEVLADSHYPSLPVRSTPGNGPIHKIRKLFGRPGGSIPKAPTKALLSFCRRANISAIYSNTITNGELLEALSPLRLPVITHVHELGYWIERAGQRNLELVKAHTTRYIAASHSVKRLLCSEVGISPDVIDVVHEFISVAEVQSFRPTSASLRTELGILESALVVAGSGFETHRKGKDLFVQLAAEVQRIDPSGEFHFLWVGGWEDDSKQKWIETMVHDNRLDTRVTFVGQVSNPLEFFAAADIFAMVSREDPFPLVCLEAAALSKPILCFSDAGGMTEFVEDDCGFIVPFLDVEEMASKIQALAKNRPLAKELGENAARKVKNRHDVSVGGPKIVRVVSELLK